MDLYHRVNLNLVGRLSLFLAMLSVAAWLFAMFTSTDTTWQWVWFWRWCVLWLLAEIYGELSKQESTTTRS